MTTTLNNPNRQMTEDEYREPTAAEIEQWQRKQVFANPEHTGPDQFPRLWNLSTGMLMNRIMRPLVPDAPEYLTIDLPVTRLRDEDGDDLKRGLAVHKWNSLWESAQFRRRFFDEDDLTPDLAKIADRGDFNIIFVPRTQSRYYEYAPLYHLLSREMCERFGLPLLGRGCWPFTLENVPIDKYVPFDFHERLSRAWAATVWRHLNSGSPVRAFSQDDPVRLLAHNLDFWIPPVTAAIQATLGDYPEIEGEGGIPDVVHLVDGSILEGAVHKWPRMGGDLWRGEKDAAEFVEWTVEEADATGRLRGILEAVRSNRVEEDFSDRWSNARSDFERRLYRTRSKVKVTFVELPDNIPVQGPETEVEGRLVFSDFMALLNEKERQVIVLLSNGVTKLHEIAAEMGYANHSPVSKKLAKIREQAAAFFDARD